MPFNMTSSIFLSTMTLTTFVAKYLWDNRRKAFFAVAQQEA